MMQVTHSSRKNFTVLILGSLLLIVVSGAAWFAYTSSLSYKKISFGETTLYLPKKYLEKEPDDLREMATKWYKTRDYTQTNLKATLGDFLPEIGQKFSTEVANTGIILTLQASAEATKTHRDVKGNNLTDLATALKEGTKTIRPYEGNGLYRLDDTEGTSNIFIITNLSKEALLAGAETGFLAHCVMLGGVSKSGSWARCGTSIIEWNLKINLYFDSRLLEAIGSMRAATREKIDSWRTKPSD